jgi:hypothetical protein
MLLKNSAFQRVKVVLPEPLAPAINVSLGRVTAIVGWVQQAASVVALQEFLVVAFFRLPAPHGRSRPSSVRIPAGSQP